MIARMPSPGRPARLVVRQPSRVALAIGLALLTSACSFFSSPSHQDVDKADAYIKRAASDTEIVADRARVYNEVNSRKRAAIEVEEAEVILQKARDEQARIRRAYRAAMAVLSAVPDQNADSLAATEEADRIKAILAASDRRVAEIEKTVASLRAMDIPPTR